MGSKTVTSGSNGVTDRKAKAKSSKRMKQIFVGKVFSFSGDFGANWAHEQVANWIKAHGGKYEREVTDDTTHLICTIEHYKQKTDQVKKAVALGKKCHIVVRDWLEDCLIGHAKHKRCRVEKPYTLGRVLKRVKNGLEKQKEYRLKFALESVLASEELVNNDLNHVYYDQTGFEYKVVCTRLKAAGKVKSEKYTIYLFESHAKPCHYMAGAKLTSPGRKASYWRTECHPKRFWEAFRDFTGWFKNITGIEWDDRLDNLPHDPDKFRYTPPKPGRPVGALPPGKLPPSWEESKDNNGDDTDSEVDFEAEVKVEEATSTELGDGYTSTERGDRDSSMERREKEASVSSISSEAPSSATSVPLEMYPTYPNM